MILSSVYTDILITIDIGSMFSLAKGHHMEVIKRNHHIMITLLLIVCFMLRTLNKMLTLVKLTTVFHCFNFVIFPHFDLSVQYNFGSGHFF